MRLRPSRQLTPSEGRRPSTAHHRRPRIAPSIPSHLCILLPHHYSLHNSRIVARCDWRSPLLFRRRRLFLPCRLSLISTLIPFAHIRISAHQLKPPSLRPPCASTHHFGSSSVLFPSTPYEFEFSASRLQAYAAVDITRRGGCHSNRANRHRSHGSSASRTSPARRLSLSHPPPCICISRTSTLANVHLVAPLSTRATHHMPPAAIRRHTASLFESYFGIL